MTNFNKRALFNSTNQNKFTIAKPSEDKTELRKNGKTIRREALNKKAKLQAAKKKSQKVIKVNVKAFNDNILLDEELYAQFEDKWYDIKWVNSEEELSESE